VTSQLVGWVSARARSVGLYIVLYHRPFSPSPLFPLLRSSSLRSSSLRSSSLRSSSLRSSSLRSSSLRSSSLRSSSLRSRPFFFHSLFSSSLFALLYSLFSLPFPFPFSSAAQLSLPTRPLRGESRENLPASQSGLGSCLTLSTMCTYLTDWESPLASRLLVSARRSEKGERRKERAKSVSL
jgi:hypothetical protein